MGGGREDVCIIMLWDVSCTLITYKPVIQDSPCKKNTKCMYMYNVLGTLLYKSAHSAFEVCGYAYMY